MGLIMDDAKKLGEAFKYGVAFSEGYKHRRGVAQDDKCITNSAWALWKRIF